MAIDFTGIIRIISDIASATKRLRQTRSDVEVNEVTIHLQEIILDLQSKMSLAQAEYQGVLAANDDLRQELADRKTWDEDRARYHLEKVGTLAFAYVYALNVKRPSVEPPHWLCAHCYEAGKKSILQMFDTHRYQCPNCKTTFQITGYPK